MDLNKTSRFSRIIQERAVRWLGLRDLNVIFFVIL